MPRSALSEKLASGKSDEWATPRWLVAALRQEFDLWLDVAARQENRIAPAYFGPDHPVEAYRDALAVPNWRALLDSASQHRRGDGRPAFAFMNPPFSLIEAFLEKAARECRDHGLPIVGVLPHKSETPWYHEAANQADEIRAIRGRLTHKRADGTGDSAFFPSVVVIWNGRAPRFATGPRLIFWDARAFRSDFLKEAKARARSLDRRPDAGTPQQPATPEHDGAEP